MMRREHGNDVTKEQIIFAATVDLAEEDASTKERTVAFVWKNDTTTGGAVDVCLRRKFAPGESL